MLKWTKNDFLFFSCFIISILVFDLCSLSNEFDRIKKENKELTEKAKPTVRMYNQSKCNCVCQP